LCLFWGGGGCNKKRGGGGGGKNNKTMVVLEGEREQEKTPVLQRVGVVVFLCFGSFGVLKGELLTTSQERTAVAERRQRRASQQHNERHPCYELGFLSSC